jgi:hypothetical protein
MRHEIKELGDTLETPEKAPPPEERNWRIIIEWALFAGGIFAIVYFLYSASIAPKPQGLSPAMIEVNKALENANITIISKPTK